MVAFRGGISAARRATGSWVSLRLHKVGIGTGQKDELTKDR